MHVQQLVAMIGLVALLLTGCGLPQTPTPGAVEANPAATLPSVQESVSPEEPAFGADPSPGIVPSPTQPSPTETTSPSPTPAPVLRQLTSGGCCVDPFWSPDGEQVFYIDKPSEDAPSGIWGIPMPSGEPEFFTDRLGIFSPDMTLRATLVNEATVVEQLATGEQWRIPNEGRAVSFSADGEQLAWTAGQSDPPFDSAQREVWVSRFDGSQARQVFSTTGGGFAGWFPDGRLLVSGRVEGEGSEQAYWALKLDQGGSSEPELVELAHGGRLREASISPNGSWLVYMVTFSTDPNQDGLWLVDMQNGERSRLDVFGSYQWRDGDHLLVVPLELEQPSHRLLQVDAYTGDIQALTDPGLTPLKIANGDWIVSPGGARIAFTSAEDGNIWLLELP